MTILSQRSKEEGGSPGGPRQLPPAPRAHRAIPLALAVATLCGAGPLLAQPAPSAPPLPSAAPSASATPSAPATPPASPIPSPSPGTPAAGAGAAGPSADEKTARAQAETLYKAARNMPPSRCAEALPLFQRARRVSATWGAENGWKARLGEGACLNNLGRFDEALDVFLSTLRDAGATLPKAYADAAQKEIDRLRTSTGTLMLTGAEVGALIVIDGRERGSHPLPGPIPLLPGEHLVKVYKAGFSLVEETVDIPRPDPKNRDTGSGKTLAVKLVPIASAPAGKLRVAESGGRKMTVVVDGVPVGETPWEGPVSAGEHTVELRPVTTAADRGSPAACGDPTAAAEVGSVEHSLSTVPKRVVVKAGETADVPLKAEAHAAWLRVLPTPATARLALDGIAVGKGGYQGRLPPGDHVIDLSADGYLPEKRSVTVRADEEQTLSIPMTRDPDSPLWAPERRLAIELHAGVPLAPSFGGDLVESCGEGCQSGLATGARVALRGSYPVTGRLGLGLTVGYLGLQQSVSGRRTTLHTGAGPLAATVPLTTRDTVAIHGFSGGAHAQYQFGERSPVRVGLSAGVGLGSISDTRLGYGALSVGPVVQSGFFPWIFVEPELVAGVRLTEHLTLGVNMSVLLVFFPNVPRWSQDMRVRAQGAGGAEEQVGTFAPEQVTGSPIFALTPGLDLRYEL